jgi:hypothetical protein
LLGVRRKMAAFSEVLSGVRLKGAMFFSDDRGGLGLYRCVASYFDLADYLGRPVGCLGYRGRDASQHRPCSGLRI